MKSITAQQLQVRYKLIKHSSEFTKVDRNNGAVTKSGNVHTKKQEKYFKWNKWLQCRTFRAPQQTGQTYCDFAKLQIIAIFGALCCTESGISYIL